MADYAYKFRLYPTAEQKEFITKSIGCVRFVYNYMLYKAKEDYEKHGTKWNLYAYKKLLPQLKQQYPFLKEINSQSLQQAVINLDNAFEAFFAKRSGFPTFKKKKHERKGSFCVPQHFKIAGDKIYIPKLKTPIKAKIHRKIEGTVRSLTITKTATDKYYVSILVEYKAKILPFTNRACGIDLGVKDFATITIGNQDRAITYKISNPKHLAKYEKQLKTLQKQLSRKQHPRYKGDKTPFSNNYLKHSQKIAKLYEKITNARNDFLHKLSSDIINENQVIVVEDLNVKGMMQNRHLSKAISDVSWHAFIQMLKYKSQWYGRQLIQADRFYPSSKTCSYCGYVNTNLELSDRAWVCPNCGAILDRDANASVNLYLVGLEQPELTPVERGSVADPMVVTLSYAKKHPLCEAGSFSIY